MPRTIIFKCPVCFSYKIWLIFEFEEGNSKKPKIYKITSIPSEGNEDIQDLPDDPPSLRKAYQQAIRSMDANAHIAAAAMFRRALQAITREILNATPGNLANELKELVGKKYNGVIIDDDFADNGYIVKEAGNQSAHPDTDPDLLDFTAQDAKDLQSIFMQIVSELFVAPKAAEQAKLQFLARRKIKA